MNVKESGAFWKDGWRKKLCRCANCMAMYKERSLEFLIDESDTVHNYEQRGRDKTASSQYEKGMQALSSMNRVQQVEVLHGFNDLKSELTDYLKKFAENGKVVKEEDIREFFSGMEQGNARGLRDQCSLCVNNGDKLTSHTFQRFLTILCTFQEEMSKLCSI